jgi:hypothetical protein
MFLENDTMTMSSSATGLITQCLTTIWYTKALLAGFQGATFQMIWAA